MNHCVSLSLPSHSILLRKCGFKSRFRLYALGIGFPLMLVCCQKDSPERSTTSSPAESVHTADFSDHREKKNKDSHLEKGGEIIVIGIASNLKEGAIVKDENDKYGGFYMIDELSQWPTEYYGKKVKVTGFLKLVTYEGNPENVDLSNVSASRKGTFRFIREASWTLVSIDD